MTKGRKVTAAEKAELLTHLDRAAWASTAEIQHRWRLSYWTTSYLLRAMLREGRVEQRVSPVDRRAREWRVTGDSSE